MDDYELDNARQWDDTLADVPQKSEPPSSEWQVVGPKKTNKVSPRKTAVTHRPRQPAPTPAPPQQAQLPRPGPRQWQWKKTQQQPQNRPRRPAPRPPKLVEGAETAAQLSWRQREPPTDTVRIPAAMVHADRAENDPPTYEKLALEQGAFASTTEAGNTGATLEFGLWGEYANVAVAKRAILEWIEVANPFSTKSAGSAKFGKVVSLTDELRKRAERNWAREIKRNRYRQLPPADLRFEAIAHFHWPSNEYAVEDVLGMSCEALDPLRIDHSCYIQFIRERTAFQVCGKASNVRQALMGIRQAYFQLASRVLAPTRAYLIHWRNGTVPTHVYLEDYQLPVSFGSISAGSGNADVVASPRGEGYLEDQRQIKLEQMNSTLSVARVRTTVGNALRKLHYYRGALKLQVRLGHFILESFLKPEDDLYELSEYLEMTQASQFKARVTDEFGNRSIEHRLLDHLKQAGHLLCPQDAQTVDLADVRPSYSAIFLFDHEGRTFRLSVTWHFSQSNELGEPVKEWTRLDNEFGDDKKLLDMSLTDLHSGLAWHFDITTSEAMDPKRIPPELRKFAEKVRLDQSKLRMSQNPFVVFNPFIQPRALRQSISYHYGIIGTDYTLELTQFQHRMYKPRSIAQPQTEVTVYEPRWSVNVVRPEWKSMFGTNKTLAVGATADWSDDMEHWFPREWGADESVDGFNQLVDKLVEIEKVVLEIPNVDEDDLLGGMNVS